MSSYAISELVEFRVVSEIREQGGTRVGFIVSSATPNKLGLHLKYVCFAFDEVADRLKKVKIGSVLNLSCEAQAFNGPQGPVIQYRVNRFSYASTSSGSGKSNTNQQQTSNSQTQKQVTSDMQYRDVAASRREEKPKQEEVANNNINEFADFLKSTFQKDMRTAENNVKKEESLSADNITEDMFVFN